MRIVKKGNVVVSLSVLALSAALGACQFENGPDRSGEGDGKKEPVFWYDDAGFVLPSGVAIKNAEGADVTGTTMTLLLNETMTLSEAVTPKRADNKAVIWESSDSRVAAIGNNGVITPVTLGEAVIRVTTLSGQKTAECTVKVAAPKGVYDTETGALLTDDIAGVEGALTWIKENGEDEGEYTIRLDADEDISALLFIGTYDALNGANSSTGPRKHLKIILLPAGASGAVTLTKTSPGPLFYLCGFNNEDVPTLILEEGITLAGSTGSNGALVCVGNNTTDKKGVFEMRHGSRITGNTSTDQTSPGGVGVYAYSTFRMTGGSIDNNRNTHASTQGAGVRVAGIFEMSGGQIINNICSGTTTPCGGGVYVVGTVNANTRFTMSGDALIGYNSAKRGAGVFFNGLYNAVFSMEGGTIEGNIPSAAGSLGSGVLRIGSLGIFRKTGGTIYGAEAGEKANSTANSTHVIQVGTSNVAEGTYSDETAGPEITIYNTSTSSLGLGETDPS